MSLLEVVLRILGAILALAFVLFLAWLTLHWMGRRMPGRGMGSSRFVQVIERLSVGRGSAILLLRVEDKVLLVGVSEHAFEKLAEFDDPEGKMKLPDAPESLPFSAALKDAVAQMKNRKNGPGGEGKL